MYDGACGNVHICGSDVCGCRWRNWLCNHHSLYVKVPAGLRACILFALQAWERDSCKTSICSGFSDARTENQCIRKYLFLTKWDLGKD